MPTLAANVTLVDPATGLDVSFLAGDAAVPTWAQQMILNPGAWVGGVAPYSAPTPIDSTQVDIKQSVRVASVVNIASLSGLLTVNGVALVDGDRVLVKAQTDATQNGIRIARAGAWPRAADADSAAEVTSGMSVFASEGTVDPGTWWSLTTPDPIVVGTTPLTFAAAPAAGTGLLKSGATIKLAPPATGLANLAALPAAAAGNAGQVQKTADGAVYWSDGTTWQVIKDPTGTYVSLANRTQFSVRDQGVSANNVNADNSAAILNAFAAASAAGGGVVVIQDVLYVAANAINIPSNVYLLMTPGSMVKVKSGTTGMRSVFQISAKNHCGIFGEGAVIDGNEANVTIPGNYAGVYITDQSGTDPSVIRIMGIELTACGNGIEMYCAQDLWFDIYVHDTGKASVNGGGFAGGGRTPTHLAKGIYGRVRGKNLSEVGLGVTWTDGYNVKCDIAGNNGANRGGASDVIASFNGSSHGKAYVRGDNVSQGGVFLRDLDDGVTSRPCTDLDLTVDLSNIHGGAAIQPRGGVLGSVVSRRLNIKGSVTGCDGAALQSTGLWEDSVVDLECEDNNVTGTGVALDANIKIPTSGKIGPTKRITVRGTYTDTRGAGFKTVNQIHVEASDADGWKFEGPVVSGHDDSGVIYNGTNLQGTPTSVGANRNGTYGNQDGQMAWNGGVGHRKELSATATWNPANMADGAYANTIVTVTGAALGDQATAGFTQSLPDGVIMTAMVTFAAQVTVTLFNKSGGAVDLSSGTVKVLVTKL